MQMALNSQYNDRVQKYEDKIDKVILSLLMQNLVLQLTIKKYQINKEQ